MELVDSHQTYVSKVELMFSGKIYVNDICYISGETVTNAHELSLYEQNQTIPGTTIVLMEKLVLMFEIEVNTEHYSIYTTLAMAMSICITLKSKSQMVYAVHGLHRDYNFFFLIYVLRCDFPFLSTFSTQKY